MNAESTPSFEEIMQNLEATIRSSMQNHQHNTQTFNQILDNFQDFLTTKPAPPQSWLERLGDKAHLYDYHQIVLPPELCDPYKTELENIEHIRELWQHRPCMALEAQLILRNKFLYTDQHYPSIPAPKPIINLEMNEEVDDNWDCCITIYPDGSYWSYNFDKDDVEDLGTDAIEEVIQYQEIIAKMSFIIPIEGYDYGIMKL